MSEFDTIKKDLKDIPTWVWWVGAGVVAVMFVIKRLSGTSAASTTGTTSTDSTGTTSTDTGTPSSASSGTDMSATNDLLSQILGNQQSVLSSLATPNSVTGSSAVDNPVASVAIMAPSQNSSPMSADEVPAVAAAAAAATPVKTAQSYIDQYAASSSQTGTQIIAPTSITAQLATAAQGLAQSQASTPITQPGGYSQAQFQTASALAAVASQPVGTFVTNTPAQLAAGNSVNYTQMVAYQKAGMFPNAAGVWTVGGK